MVEKTTGIYCVAQLFIVRAKIMLEPLRAPG